MKKILLGCTALGLTLAVAAVPASAAPMSGSFSMQVATGATNGSGFNAGPTFTFPFPTASATFTYTGTLNFNLNAAQNSNSSGDLNSAFFGTATNAGAGSNYGITAYSGAGTYAPANADYSSPSGFLAASGSASGFAYASLYTINLGSIVAGTVLTIKHDDGVSLYGPGNTPVAGLTAGPTSAITETVTIGSTGVYTLYYGRQNGSPSVLIVDAVTPAPEPMSLALLGMGLVGLGVARRATRRA